MESFSMKSSVSTPPAVPKSSSITSASLRHHVVSRERIGSGGRFFPDGVHYIAFFEFLNKQLAPRTYFEIGTERGHSALAFKCPTVCVDPQFKLDVDLLQSRSEIHFFQMPSDVFFANHDLRALFKNGPDICFLDGMHRCEYLLRDFFNIEKMCHRRSVILLHDCLPAYPRMALRTHQLGDATEGPYQNAWTGDVWKIVPVLLKFRPDLKLFFIDCAPTGLVLITNLDPDSVILPNQYWNAVEEMREMDFASTFDDRLFEQVPILASRSLQSNPEDLTLFANFW